MPDVLLLSSVFSEVKIAEPMGACILAAACRARGIEVDIVEPSVEGWDVRRTVEEVARRAPKVVGLSMLRDKHVDAVRKFVALLRLRLPEAFVVIGGHGPSIAVMAITAEQVEEARPALAGAPRARAAGRAILDRAVAVPEALYAPFAGPFVDAEATGRGQGAGRLGPEGDGAGAREDDSAMTRRFAPLADDEDEYGMFGSVDADSPYFDKSREYLQILSAAGCYLLGEADLTFPPLVRAILDGREWRDTPGAAYFDDEGRLVRNALPAKVADIDMLPHMARDVLEEYRRRYGPGVPASILASRGCYYRCTFCSVVQYERLQEGAIHRQRSNEDLIAEISDLHERFGITHVNFEDDNFIVKNKRGIEKLHEFADRLQALPFRLSFSFFCRADAVEADLFRHLRHAGLDGIYFGMESVHDTDLEFFHKGTKATDNYRALGTLLRLGFSPAVDAERRIMLGYITWHPMTSFEGLRATGEFIRKYDAPPKLLRRQLRLYSATEVVEQVREMGLLAPETSGGWVFADPRIENLDRVVDSFAQMANETRDRLRTLEKAHLHQGLEVPSMGAIREARRAIDVRLVDHFQEVVELAAVAPMGGRSLEVVAYDREARDAFERYVRDARLPELIAAGYAACGYPFEAKDLFRK